MNPLDQLKSMLRKAFPDADFLTTEPLAARELDPFVQSQGFLVGVGLPDVEFFGFRFGLVRTLPSLADFAVGMGMAIDQVPPSIRCIGNNYSQVVGIDLARDAVVVWCDLTRRLPEMFVNTSVELFANFIAECMFHWQRCAGGTDLTDSVGEMVAKMTAMDPRAMEGWWSCVVEELEIGLS